MAGQEYALGISSTASGKVVVTALPMPQGLSQTTARIRAGADEYWQLFRSRNRIRTTFFLMLLLITVFVFFSSVWLALFLSKQITRPVEALADAMDEIAAGKYEHRVALRASGGDGRPGAFVQPHGGGSGRQPAVGGELVGAVNRGQPCHRRAAPGDWRRLWRRFPAGVVTLDGAGVVLQSNRAFATLMGLREDAEPERGENRNAAAGRLCGGNGRCDAARATHGRGLNGN